MQNKIIKLLIVDDSAIDRQVISKLLSKYQNIKVIGTAVDPYFARDKIVKLKPDVITLDINMPKMDGLAFLERLMKYYPMPVVVFSSFTPKESDIALKAMDLGAMEVVCKPEAEDNIQNVYKELAKAIQSAGSTRINKYEGASRSAASNYKQDKTGIISNQTGNKVIAVGASTGGTVAIDALLSAMPVNSPGIAIVQHMPEKFTASFAERLNERYQIAIREARDNDCLAPGVALVAPGNRHMILKQGIGGYLVKIIDGPRVHYQRPSVDVLFQSAAENAGPNAIGVLLTGMGSDGAQGLLKMHQNGAYTIAQDEKTSIVFGMPRVAIKLKAVDKVAPLPEIPGHIFAALNK
ncbi:MAG: chemotaxis response regulator protein-glutamate methylesterase [Desulfobacteraceae bacterium 4484_190.1]|nr:MAG: chemotaxis response regulator protein-glutamate methylesterase [Desulfobacteraceae bacterium 4484_190.1]